ncbi:MAG: response regulator, partial [Bacteroidota bacterium]|nr:response regulator [Bacteroidota bacterium]
MQKAIIIDDERLARNELKKLLLEFPEVEVIGEAANANEGIEKIESLNPDLVFLDIQMPGKSGFDMLTLVERAPHVIFVTAYDEYALKAFEVNALDYLMKPVEPKRLADALLKVKLKDEEEMLSYNNRGMLHENDQVFVKDGERCWFVKLSD